MLLGNTHAHTTKSDGRELPRKVIEFYKKKGYDFVFLTDHRYDGKEVPFDYSDPGGINVIGGCEMSKGEHYVYAEGEDESIKIKAHPNRYNDPIGEVEDWNLYETCYDDETEVLTYDGWKGIDSISKKDKVLTLNPNTHYMEHQRPEKIVKRNWNGKMYSYESKYVSLLTTPNHRWYVALNRHGNNYHDFDLYPIAEISDRRFKFLKAGKWKGSNPDKINIGEYKFPIEPWLKLFGYFLAEGHTYINEDTGNYQVGFRNTGEELLPDYLKTVKKLGLNISRKNSTQPVICDKNLAIYLSQFGGAREKYIPKRIKNLDPSLLRIAFEMYMKGDGMEDRLSCSTSSPDLRDDLEEIGIKLGYGVQQRIGYKKGRTSTITEKGEKREIEAKGNNWIISFHDNNTRSNTYTKGEWIDYEGKIWCPSTKNGIVLVRRNDRITWCGNTEHARLHPKYFKCKGNYPVFSDDAHTLQGIGKAGVLVDVEKGASKDKILRNIKSGNFRLYAKSLEM